MINWLLEQTFFFTVAASMLCLLRSQLSSLVGVKGYYWLWAILPIQMLLSGVISHEQIPESIQLNIYVVNAQNIFKDSAEFSTNMIGFIGYLWLTGIVLMVLLMYIQHTHFISAVKIKAQPIADAQLIDDINNIDNKHFYQRYSKSNISVIKSHKVSSPMLIGLINPTIVFPDNFDMLSNSKKQLMLEHELVHLYRGDLIWNLTALCILSVFWFNPIAWWAYRHFRNAQEMACDVDVLANKTNTTKLLYAKTFLEQSLAATSTSLTTLHYSGIENMKERLNNIKTGVSHNWRVLPIAAILLSSSIGFQAVSADNYKAKKEAHVSPIMRIEPLYPDYALEKGLEGTVVLNFSIEKDGSVSDVKVVKSDQKGLFDASAILALQQWQYTKPKQKVRNQLVALEFALDDNRFATHEDQMEHVVIEGDH